MGAFHDEFMKFLNQLHCSESVMTELVRRVFRRRGMAESEEQIQSLVQKYVKEGSALDDSVERVNESEDRIVISVEELDHELQEYMEFCEIDSNNRIGRVVDETVPPFLESLYESLPTHLQEWKQLRQSFEDDLYKHWKEGLDRIEMLITMAHESGRNHLEDIQEWPIDRYTQHELDLIEVLTALHCRACRTAREIACLLRSGYVDGAHARWRSLHELAVTANFIVEKAGDTPKRYLDHSAVERFRSAEKYQMYCDQLGYEPFSDKEMKEMKAVSDGLIAKYGKPYQGNNGWAAEALGKTNVSFEAIEASIDMKHWRPWFKLACQNVHAGSDGLRFSLGMPDGSNGVLLAGPSNMGLTDPGHQMAISLTMATVALLNVYPTIDSLVACHSLLRVSDDIGRELLNANEGIDD